MDSDPRLKHYETGQQYVWKSRDQARQRDLEPPDSEEVPLDLYRTKEAEKITELLNEQYGVVIVNANSGYGISKFLLPRLTHELSAQNVPHFHTQFLKEILDKPLTTGEGQLFKENCVVIADELGWLQGGPIKALELLGSIKKQRPDIRLVIVNDFEIDIPATPQLLTEIFPHEKIGSVAISPKLLSDHQAMQYLAYGPPERRRKSRDRTLFGTFFAGLSDEQILELVKIIKNKYPLHFRVLDKIRGLSPYEQGTDRDNLKLTSFEKRKEELGEDVYRETMQEVFDLSNGLGLHKK